MTNEDRAVLGGKLFETYLQFEDHSDISDDELDFYVAEQIGDFLLFVATRRAGESYELVPEFVENYARISRERAEMLAKAAREGMDQHVHELLERYRHRPRGK